MHRIRQNCNLWLKWRDSAHPWAQNKRLDEPCCTARRQGFPEGSARSPRVVSCGGRRCRFLCVDRAVIFAPFVAFRRQDKGSCPIRRRARVCAVSVFARPSRQRLTMATTVRQNQLRIGVRLILFASQASHCRPVCDGGAPGSIDYPTRPSSILSGRAPHRAPPQPKA